MTRALAMGWLIGWGLVAAPVLGAEALYRQFREPPHDYFGRKPTDRFTRLKDDLESGRLRLDRTGGEKAFLRSLLEVLGIPATSQMLVFSTTSLQLSRITPSNPRALYFNDDLYLGYIPGGRLELAALDPDLGVVFYIFDIPRGEEPIQVERATRCMNCHAGEDTGYVPGLLVKSVVPGPSGGSLEAFRQGQSGHGIPWEDRFGGWYMTGQGNWTQHWANTIGRSVEGVLTRIPNPMEGRVDVSRYLEPTSDWLAQAIHEHQVGFVNRVAGLTYRARAWVQEDGGWDRLSAEHRRELDGQVEELVRYLLFTDEVPLPKLDATRQSAFQADFLKNRRLVGGHSLRDLELKTRLFAHRCSFMIESPVFIGIPAEVKSRIYRRLGDVLRDEAVDPQSPAVALPNEERAVIRTLLRATLTDLPAGW
jgi:hypothetical protein